MNNLISYISVLFFILMFSFSFSQINTNYLIENNVTNDGQTVPTKNYNEQYQHYLKKSYRQRNAATWVGVLGGVISSIGFSYYYEDPEIRKGVILTVILTSCISTTFYIRSSVNRKRAYQLKKKTYL